jgi:hypothetical protein
MVTLLAVLALATPTVGCSRHVEAPVPTAEQRSAALRSSIRVGPVTFYGLRDARTRQFGGGRGALRFRSAIGVRAGAAVSVAVASRDRGWLSLEYGGTRNDGARLKVSDGRPAIRFVPCDPRTPRFSDRRPIGGETAWAGGFIVARAGCATLRVRRDGARSWRSVRVGFGRRC